MAKSNPSGKRILTRWEWIFIIIVVGIFLYFLLKNAGVNIVSQSNDVEMTDDPHPQK